MLRVGLHHDGVMLKDHERAVFQHALLPEADVAQGASHLASGHVVVGDLDHGRDAAVVFWRLDRVLDAVVGVPVFPRHPGQVAAIGGPLGLLLGGRVAIDPDDVGLGDRLVIAVVEGLQGLSSGDGSGKSNSA